MMISFRLVSVVLDRKIFIFYLKLFLIKKFSLNGESKRLFFIFRDFLELKVYVLFE